MIRQPPGYTRTSLLLPYTTLFRAGWQGAAARVLHRTVAQAAQCLYRAFFGGKQFVASPGSRKIGRFAPVSAVRWAAGIAARRCYSRTWSRCRRSSFRAPRKHTVDPPGAIAQPSISGPNHADAVCGHTLQPGAG